MFCHNFLNSCKVIFVALTLTEPGISVIVSVVFSSYAIIQRMKNYTVILDMTL